MLGGCGKFPPWMNSPQRPFSGPLHSVQLDKPLNSAFPSALQACPLFAVCIYLFSLHGLHNIAGTQKTTEAQSRIARGSESAKKPLNPELSTVLRHSMLLSLAPFFSFQFKIVFSWSCTFALLALHLISYALVALPASSSCLSLLVVSHLASSCLNFFPFTKLFFTPFSAVFMLFLGLVICLLCF